MAPADWEKPPGGCHSQVGIDLVVGEGSGGDLEVLMGVLCKFDDNMKEGVKIDLDLQETPMG